MEKIDSIFDFIISYGTAYGIPSGNPFEKSAKLLLKSLEPGEEIMLPYFGNVKLMIKNNIKNYSECLAALTNKRLIVCLDKSSLFKKDIVFETAKFDKEVCIMLADDSGAKVKDNWVGLNFASDNTIACFEFTSEEFALRYIEFAEALLKDLKK